MLGGLWYAKRRKPGDKALYIESEKRDAYCVHPTKKNKDNTPMEAMGVSTTRGKHIVLCPAAFKNPQDLAASKDTVYPDNTEIGRFDGLSATLLHEVTHCIFGSKWPKRTLGVLR